MDFVRSNACMSSLATQDMEQWGDSVDGCLHDCTVLYCHCAVVQYCALFCNLTTITLKFEAVLVTQHFWLQYSTFGMEEWCCTIVLYRTGLYCIWNDLTVLHCIVKHIQYICATGLHMSTLQYCISSHSCAPKLRTIAIRKSAGKFIAEPQEVYDAMSDLLKHKQVSIEDLFWLEDEHLHLDLCIRRTLL